ncbi:MAG: TlyA family RNA methyltransferase [Christensenellales bacterium]
MKQRLDVYLVEEGMCESREKAKRLIMAGQVLLNGSMAKPSDIVEQKDEIVIKAAEKYVSRGGYKLEKALAVFGINVHGLCCADIGASTGGFTDCLLQNGARKVYAVDVGYGQLSWKLREDARVAVMERMNARLLKQEDFEEKFQFVTMDVSFISVGLVLPAVKPCCTDDAGMVVLVKPQFEAGREFVGSHGVVRSEQGHLHALVSAAKAAKDCALVPTALDYSPIKGPEGNIEFIMHIRAQGEPVTQKEMELIVQKAHRNFFV